MHMDSLMGPWGFSACFLDYFVMINILFRSEMQEDGLKSHNSTLARALRIWWSVGKLKLLSPPPPSSHTAIHTKPLEVSSRVHLSMLGVPSTPSS